MNLKIPADQAIQILQARLAEINDYAFNPKAWKDRTENDLREIFPLGSMQWLQVSQIHFDTFVTAEKAKVMAEGRDTAKELIESYIDFIRQYSKIAQQKQVIKEKDYEQKYKNLLKEWNDLIPGYNELVKKYDDQLTYSEELLETIEANDKENERIKSETIQLDNVSFKKLWKALFNLPIGQLIGFFSTFLALIIAAFSLGTLYEKTNSNIELFDTRNTNKELQNQNEKLKFSNDSLRTEMKKSYVVVQVEQPDEATTNSILKIIRRLPNVQKLEKEVETLSKNKRHISYSVLFDDSTKTNYNVRVGEDNGMSVATYFNFKIEAKTLKVLNPDGKDE